MEGVLKISARSEMDIIDITDKVSAIVNESNVKDGICLVFCKGSTGAIIINESESGLLEDLKDSLKKLAPEGGHRHPDNAHSHIRAAILGQGESVPVKDGDLFLGAWQNIFLVNLDTKPREREVIVQVVGD